MQSCFSFKIKEKQFCIKLLRQRFDQRIFDSWFLPRWQLNVFGQWTWGASEQMENTIDFWFHVRTPECWSYVLLDC